MPLGVQLWTSTDDGALAFPSEAATAAIDAGGVVELGGVTLESSGDGLVAVDAAGEAVGAQPLDLE